MGKYSDLIMHSQEMTRDDYISTAISVFLDGGLSIKALMLMAMDWQCNRIASLIHKRLNEGTMQVDDMYALIEELKNNDLWKS